MWEFKNITNDLIGLFFPNLCLLCNQELLTDEQHICSQCLISLPETNFHNHEENNALEQKIKGRFPFEAASAFYYFNTASQVQEILHQIKYRGNKQLAIFMGELIAQKLGDFFTNVDLIVPIPLHRKRIEERGYNQSELMAQGLGEAIGLPFENSLVARVRNTETQTHKTRQERIDNMKDAFEWYVPAKFYNKHLLLLDDVITTGSTLESLITVAPAEANLKFTILS